MAKSLNISNFLDKEGLLVVALPNRTQPLLAAISRKTGADMANVFSAALQILASKVLTKEELQEVKREMDQFSE